MLKLSIKKRQPSLIDGGRVLLLFQLQPMESLPFVGQPIADQRVLSPKLILPQNITSAKLAPFPIDPQLLLARIFANMLVNLPNFEGQPALLALSMEMGFLTLLQKVFRELSDVDQAAALLAKC